MKTWKIVLIIIVILLICIRMTLPIFLLKYVVRQINKIPEYHVKIADLDVHLYRGSYTIKNIQLWKTTAKIPLPYFQAQTIDFSIEWKSILQGRWVAKIIVYDPIINLVTDPGKNKQLTISSRWLEIVKSLFPLNINRLEVYQGKIYFINFRGNPPFKTYIQDIHFILENMQNAKGARELLSSSFIFNGMPMQQGKIDIKGHFDPFNKTPTFDMNAQLTSLSVSQIANLLKHYTKVDVTGGTFSLYGEAAAAKGRIKGYAKPFMKNLKIGAPKKSSPLSALADNLASVAKKILENPKQKTIATKINISGRIDDPDTSLLSIIGYLIQHAFINALLPQVDDSIGIKDVYYGKKPPKRSIQKKHSSL